MNKNKSDETIIKEINNKSKRTKAGNNTQKYTRKNVSRNKEQSYNKNSKKKLSMRKIMKKLIRILLTVFLLILLIRFLKSKDTVIIDPGHGGSDPGAVYVTNDGFEKDDNLKVALEVKKILKKNKIRVIMTRTKDDNVSLSKRCTIANLVHADLYVSIHRNSSEQGKGLEIWCSEKESDMLLSENILQELEKEYWQANRGIKNGTIHDKNGDYYVNKYTNMPSCILELGFVTNKKDNEFYERDYEKYAQRIADGILNTLREDKKINE